jgi:hypothetical protein
MASVETEHESVEEPDGSIVVYPSTEEERRQHITTWSEEAELRITVSEGQSRYLADLQAESRRSTQT